MNEVNRDENLSKRDFYEQYWRCRDFELTTLWQRSIFLGTFLILCFTGYGAYFGKAFISEDTCLALCCYDNLQNKIFEHVIADFLALIGMVSSMLWIAMAKGSKAWYERYENAIDAIEKEMQSTSSTYEQFTCGFKCFNRLFYHETNLDEHIFSGKGGPFSPSKVNVALGQVALIIWSAIFCFHVFFILGQIFNGLVGTLLFTETSIFSILFCLVLLTFFVVTLSAGLPMAIGLFDIKSESLKNWCKENEYSKHADALTLLDKIRRGVLSNIGTIPTEIVGDGNVYLVIPIRGMSNFKLDIFKKDYRIFVCFKRGDNKSFESGDVSLLREKEVKVNEGEYECKVGVFKRDEMKECIEEVVNFLRKLTT